MNRKNFLQSAALGIGALTFQQSLLAQVFQQEAWKIKMLTDTIGVFTERGGTILFYLSKEGIVVVDTQFPEQSNHLITELKKRSEQPFKLLINTHHHGDHSSGNISFKGLVENVLAHENSKRNQERVAQQSKTEDKQLFPNQTFGKTWSQKIGTEKITLHYFGAAHTDGDALIHFEDANIVHMGDLINNRRYPFIDRTAGASIKNWIEVLEKTTKHFNKKTTFVYGHASEGFEVYGKVDDIKAMQHYFEKLLLFGETEVKAGTTKEAFVKNKSIPGVTEWVGSGIERSLIAVYDELTSK